MAFHLREYHAPDFTEAKFQTAPDAVLVPAPQDKTAPDHFHALSIFPEYFKIHGTWLWRKTAEWTAFRCIRMAGFWLWNRGI